MDEQITKSDGLNPGENGKQGGQALPEASEPRESAEEKIEENDGLKNSTPEPEPKKEEPEPKASEASSGGEGFKFPYGIAFIFFGVALISFIYFAYGKSAEALQLDKNIALPMLFAFGVVTGLHCIGMCGSFLIAYTSKNIANGTADRWAHLKYGAGKTLSYTMIGGVFGFIGSVFAFTPEIRGAIGILAGVFLIIYGLNMLNIFPALRKLQLRLPSFGQAEKVQNKGPFYMGLANGLFIACGPLQAMYIYAAGTGSPVQGALSLLVFGLGTLPFMMLFGFSLSSLSKHLHKIIKFSGALVLVLGLVMANNGFNLLGFSGFASAPAGGSIANVSNGTGAQVQTIKMTVDGFGWSPDSFVLKKGVKVRWVIDVKELTSCNKEIIVRDYGLDIKLRQGENIVEFTPDKEGTVRWSCWMGMIPGTFQVVN
ncbi:MAG: sulfite exporter TauE/SafE family protein [Candidatus ainarchaeum sp.]|nr:sulfite exporter TauE/SafE family protein [Candidatus ainarchaeum sp.]